MTNKYSDIEKVAVECGIIDSIEAYGEFKTNEVLLKARREKLSKLESFAKAMLEAAPPADVEPVAWRNPNDNHRASAFMWQQSATHSKPVFTQPPADKDAERIEQLEDCLDKIRSWCKAYPTTIFTEPNWDEVQEKLGKNLLCQVSGSNMRHVTTGIQKIIDATMGEAMGEV